MLIAVLMLCGLRVYILSPRLKSGHFNRTPGRRPTFATRPPPLVAVDSTLRLSSLHAYCLSSRELFP